MEPNSSHVFADYSHLSWIGHRAAVGAFYGITQLIKLVMVRARQVRVTGAVEASSPC